MENDREAEDLTKAIRQKESGGDFGTVGDAGTSHGAYQFQPETWKQYSKDILGDENAPMTPQNQNAVAYGKIKTWKDQGKNAAEIAAMWNAGENIGDKWQTNKGKTTINGKTISYDTPQYVKDVTDIYQKMKQGAGQNIVNVTGAKTVEASNGTSAQPDTRDFLQKTGDVVNSIFPGKQVGQAIGTLGGLALEKAKGLLGGHDNSEYYNTSAPSPLQVVGDVAQGALMVGTGQPEGVTGLSAFGKTAPVLQGAESALGRIGQAGLVGAGFGVTNALKEGKTNAGDIAKQGAIGGAVGGALGSAGELIQKASNVLPQSITRKFLPGTNPDTVEYAINKGLGSPSKMLNESNTSIKDLGTQLGKELNDPKYADLQVDGKALFKKVASDFADSGMTPKEIASKLKSLVPLKATLVDKLQKGTITLKELHSLNSALGNNTFKTVFDDATVKAGKEVGSNIYHSISDYINNVTRDASGDSVTEPLFNDLSKEYQLNKALQGIVRRGEKARSLTLKDLVAFSSGLGFGGPFGGIGAVVGEKALTNPTVNLKTAGLISKVGGKTAQQLGRGLINPVLSRTTK